MLLHVKEKKEKKKKEREQTVLLFLSYCPFCRNYVQIAMGTHLGVFCIKKHESTNSSFHFISDFDRSK